MNTEQTRFDIIFGLQWFVGSALGLVIGGMLAFSSMWAIGEAVESALGEVAAFLAMGGVFGVVLGLGANLGPALLLQSRGISAARWILTSLLSGAIGAAFGFAFTFTFLDPDTMPEPLFGLVMGFSIGLPLGIGQWLVLRGRDLPAGLWWLISALAFLVGMTIGIPLGGEGREWIALGVMSLLTSAISALGTAWFFRQRVALT